MVGGSTISADAVVALSRAIDATTDRGELEEAIRLASLQGAELTREQAIAETLQRSLLPEALADVTLALEEQELADSARLRLSARSGRAGGPWR